MKKILFMLTMILISSQSIAATYSEYVKLFHEIQTLNKYIPKNHDEKLFISMSNNFIPFSFETIGESIIMMNAFSDKNGSPIFCPPEELRLDSKSIGKFISKGYKLMDRPDIEKQAMPISTFAIYGLVETYPCKR